MRWAFAFAFLTLVYGASNKQPVIWQEPAKVSLTFSTEAPQPPFTFYDQDKGGTSSKLIVKDATRRMWNVKWGEEVKAETFATRMVNAMGYFAEPSYYVAAGKLDSVGKAGRAESKIDRANGNAFTDARFEFRDINIHMLPTSNWSFDNNPFRGTPQLNGLKIMMMLLSNWDVKDARSNSGPNTALVEQGDKLWYAVTDWGGSMGKWGHIATRSKWDCEGYASQSDDFIKGVDNGMIEFGYSGKRQDDIRRGITVNDARWLMNYLGRLTDDEIRTALTESGASSSEMTCFSAAIRKRIDALAKVAGATVTSRATER